jgi:hypothetical protein
VIAKQVCNKRMRQKHRVLNWNKSINLVWNCSGQLKEKRRRSMRVCEGKQMYIYKRTRDKLEMKRILGDS